MMNFAFRARTLLFLAATLSGCHLVVDFDASRIGADASTDSGSVTQDMGMIVVDGGDADVDDAGIDMGDVDMDVADMGDVDMDTIDMNVPDMTVPVDMTTPDMCTPATFYQDLDEDGAGNPFVTTSACTAPAGYVANDDDCDDDDDDVYGSATEVCDSKDNDCDLEIDEGVKTTYYPDADEDTYGNSAASVEACTAPAQHVTRGGDCEDDNGDIHPGADELCDGVDNDCDAGTADGTGEATFGDACDESGDESCGGTIICGGEGLDCSVHPVGFCYVDNDEDTFGNVSTQYQSCACEAGGGVDNGLDCNDNDQLVNPLADEVCDGENNDCDLDTLDGSDEPTYGDACDESTDDTCPGNLTCDGTALVCDNQPQGSYFRDADNDGYGDVTSVFLSCSPGVPAGASENSTDCNDASGAANPGIMFETIDACTDGLDNDCDSFTDIADDADCGP